MKNKHTANRFLILALPLLWLVATLTVTAAPPIAVNSATPNEAEQGITLPVTISGRGFGEDSVVEFVVSGSCVNEGEMCDTGEIVVNSVAVESSKKLVATITVGGNAVLGLRDIKILSNGRRGRGTELFRVLQKGAGKSETVDCKIDFSVQFRDDGSDRVLSDGVAGGVYPDPNNRRDKSAAGTHSGPGFRFDTNGSQKLEGAGGTRELEIHVIPMGSTSSGVDFRFHLNSGGLDLCSLAGGGAPGTVPMILAFADDSGEEFALLYGCIKHDATPFTGGGGSPVDVTRTGGDADTWAPGDTWTIEGGQACLITSNNYATATDVLIDNDVDASFQMTITAQ